MLFIASGSLSWATKNCIEPAPSLQTPTSDTVFVQAPGNDVGKRSWIDGFDNAHTYGSASSEVDSEEDGEDLGWDSVTHDQVVSMTPSSNKQVKSPWSYSRLRRVHHQLGGLDQTASGKARPVSRFRPVRQITPYTMRQTQTDRLPRATSTATDYVF